MFLLLILAFILDAMLGSPRPSMMDRTNSFLFPLSLSTKTTQKVRKTRDGLIRNPEEVRLLPANPRSLYRQCEGQLGRKEKGMTAHAAQQNTFGYTWRGVSSILLSRCRRGLVIRKKCSRKIHPPLSAIGKKQRSCARADHSVVPGAHRH